MAKLLATSQLDSPTDTYFYALAEAAGDLAVIGSDNTLRLFDVRQLSVRHIFPSCNAGVECLTGSTDGQSLITGGRDGLIRCWDARSKSRTLEIQEPKAAGFSALACHEQYIAAGTESTKEGLGDVSVHVFDTRKPSAPLRSYGESHTDTITDIAWHPSQTNILLTGSTDGLVSIFDVAQADEEDALQQVLNPRSAVHCSGFIADDQAYVLSTDEQFSVYGLNKSGTAEDEALPVAEFGDLRPKLDCMYVINLLQSRHISAPVLAYGHNDKQTLALTFLDRPGYAFGQAIDLPGAHSEEVVRDVRFVSDTTLLTCGEDGKVKAWSIDTSKSSTGSMDIDEPSSSSKKRIKKEKKHAERFTPY